MPRIEKNEVQVKTKLLIQDHDKLEYRKRVMYEKNECRRLRQIRLLGTVFFTILLTVCLTAMVYLEPTPIMS